MIIYSCNIFFLYDLLIWFRFRFLFDFEFFDFFIVGSVERRGVGLLEGLVVGLQLIFSKSNGFPRSALHKPRNPLVGLVGSDVPIVPSPDAGS